MALYSGMAMRVSLVTTLLGLCSAAAAQGEFSKITVFESGSEGYNIYRIPTIVKAANGDLLAFAEARSGGDASEIDIVMKRSTDGGAAWGSLQVVIENNSYRGWDGLPFTNVTAGNQSPVVDLLDPINPGRIWMPFTLENDRVFVTYSDDHGATWDLNGAGRAREITSTAKLGTWDWYATGPVHGIQLTRGEHAGRLIIPSDHRQDAGDYNGAHVLYSDDHGQSWSVGAVETSGSGSTTSPNENVAVELVDGRVYFNARDSNSANPGNRSITHSSDGGLTYDALFAHEPAISSPVVQNSSLRFRATDEGDLENVILYSSPGKLNNREDMTILVSLDEAQTWTRETLIHEGPSAYSDLVKIDNNRFGVLFEAGDQLYDKILFAAINYDDLASIGWNEIVGDVNQDGVVTSADRDLFVDVWPDPIVVIDDTYAQYQMGDLNFNGVHDIHDVWIIRAALLSNGIDASALAGLAVAVPEPNIAGSACLLLFVACTVRQVSRSSLGQGFGPSGPQAGAQGEVPGYSSIECVENRWSPLLSIEPASFLPEFHPGGVLMKLCSLLLVGALTVLWSPLAPAAVIFSDDFESYDTTPNLDPADGPWTAFGDIDNGNIGARDDVVPYFGAGNKYLEYNDNNLDGSGGTVSDDPTIYADLSATATVFTASFDFYEPTNAATDDTMKIRFGGDDSGSVGTGQIIFEVHLNDGLFNASHGVASAVDLKLEDAYELDVVNHVELVANLTGSPITYGSQTLSSNKYDIWMNKVLIAEDVRFRNERTPLTNIQINGSGGGVQQIYLDNFLIHDEAVNPVPEPTSVATAMLGVAGLLWAFRQRL